MKILMVTDFYPPFTGGVEVLVATASRELVRSGHNVSVVTLAAPGSPSREVDEGVYVHRIAGSAQRVGRLFSDPTRPWAPPVPDPEATLRLRAIVAEERPDIVHGHDWLARSYLPLARRSVAAFVMSLHYFTLACPKKDLLYHGRVCTGPGLMKCLGCAGRHYGRAKGAAVTIGHRAFSVAEAKLVDLFLPVTEATAAGNGLYEAGLPFEVVPNVVRPASDPAPHAALLATLPSEPFQLFVGDIRRNKGIDVLLDAYVRVSSPPPLVLIGKVWPETPDRLPEGVTLLRDWPNPAVRQAMTRCLALVAPSVWAEPFGIVIAEAFAAGRPVVASSIGGIPELVRHEREGLLVPAGEPAALAGALERLLDDETLRESLAAGASQRAALYTPAAVIPRLEAAYDTALRRRRAAIEHGRRTRSIGTPDRPG